MLVQHAFAVLRHRAEPATFGIEIGLGSGAISIELLAALPMLNMLASELTEAAVLRAGQNASRILGSGGRLRIVRANEPLEVWEPFEKVMGTGLLADFVISNPPYLSSSDPIEGEVIRHEPATALFAPSADLIYFYRMIALHGARYVKPGGYAFMELAPERVSEVLAVFTAAGWQAEVHQDLAGRERVLVASLPRKV